MTNPRRTDRPRIRGGRRRLPCLLLGLLLMAFAGTASTTWAQESVQQGGASAAPTFELETLDGDHFRLREHRGEVVVLNFWATWCAPCRREIPDFVNLQREYGDQGLQFVGVALQPEAEKASVARFVRQIGINYPVGLDDGSIARKYGGVRSLPTTFIIGPEGAVRGHLPGIAHRPRLLSELEGLLDVTH